MKSALPSVEALLLRLSVEPRRGRDRSRSRLGQTTRGRTRQDGEAQRGWRAGARTRPHFSSRRGRVASENEVAIFCRLVAGEALCVQRLIAGFAVGEVGESPASGRSVLF